MVSPAIRRLLEHVAKTPRGGRSYDGYGAATYAVLSGIAVKDGYLREVKHRDHTVDHRLTAAGQALLRS